jgi:hypothetical protein
MGVEQGWEKFYFALRNALPSTESPQKRLESVISEVRRLPRDSFPSEVFWEHFKALTAETTKHAEQLPGEDSIHTTASRMSDDEAKRLLQSSFDLFSDLAEACGAINGRFKPQS